MRSKLTQLSPVQHAVAMTGVAAMLFYLWFAQNDLLSGFYGAVGGVFGDDIFQLLFILTWLITLGAGAAAVASWVSLLHRRARVKPLPAQARPGPVPGHLSTERPTLRLAKSSSLVAAILLALPIAFWAYTQVVPQDCSNEACVGGVYLLVSLGMAAAAGVLFAISVWAVYLVRDREPGDRIAGPWLQVLLMDAALLLTGSLGDNPGGMVLVLVAALAYLGISIARRRLAART